MIRAFRQSPNSEYARAASRASARVDFDQRAPADRGRALRLVRRAAAVRVGQRRCPARRGERRATALRSPLTWGIVAGLVVGKFVGITGATVVHAGAPVSAQLAPGADPAPGRRRCRAVRNRFHHLAVHRRHRDHRSRPRRTRRASACWWPRSVAFRARLGASSGSPTGSSPPEPVGLKLIRRRRPRPRPHPGQPRRAADAGRVRRLRVPVLQPGHRRRSTRCGRTSATDLRYVWRHLPLERVHPRAFDAARASEAAAPAGQVLGDGSRTVRAPGRPRVVGHLPVCRWPPVVTSSSSTRTCGCTRRRCCTG